MNARPLPENRPSPRWSLSLAARPRSFSLARESHLLLTWDDHNWLSLLNRKGEVQGKVRAAGAVTGASAADDGSAFAAVGSRGEVWLLSPDLRPRWEHTLPHPAVSVALDPFGRRVAVSDARGNLYLFDRQGNITSQAQTPRALHHLAFVPEADCLVGAADFGLVTAFDATGRSLWQDRLVAHMGSLTVDGPGDRVVLACFTEGLHLFDRTGKARGTTPLPEPCRLVVSSYDGQRLVANGLEQKLYVLGRTGGPQAAVLLDGPAVALAIGPLGREVMVGFADGRVVALDVPGS